MNILSIFSPTTLDTKTMIFMIVGGLGIFLFGLHIMSSSMKDLAGNKLKMLIQKTTNTTFKAILAGCVITCIIQSSSATTVIIISLICAGLMNFKQAIGVMLGANIGTTVTAFIISLNIGDYALPIIFVGAFLICFVNKRKYNISGQAILGFGMLFLGLEFMSMALKGFKDMPFFNNMIITLGNHWSLGVLISTALTALIQSSSAFIGILEKLYESGAINLYVAIPMIFGANIGTTVTAIIASLSGSRESKQAAVANLFVKIIGCAIFLILLKPVELFGVYLQAKLGLTNPIVLALIHALFNIVLTLVMWPILPYFSKFIKLLIKDRKTSDTVISAYNLNEELLITSPILALESSKRSIVDMSNTVLKMIKLSKDYLNTNDQKTFDTVMSLEEDVDMYDHLIHDYLAKLHTERLNDSESINQAIYLDTIRDFERMGDHATNLVEYLKDRQENETKTTPELLNLFNEFFDKIILQVELSCKAFKQSSKEISEEVLVGEEEVDKLEKKYRKSQFKFITDGILESNDIHYLDLLSNLERVSDHCCNVAENVIDPIYLRRTSNEEPLGSH